MNKVSYDLSDVKDMEFENLISLIYDAHQEKNKQKIKELLDVRYPNGEFYEADDSWRRYEIPIYNAPPRKIKTVGRYLYPYIQNLIESDKEYNLYKMDRLSYYIDLYNTFAPAEDKKNYINTLLDNFSCDSWLVTILLGARTLVNNPFESEAYSILKTKFGRDVIVDVVEHYSFNQNISSHINFIADILRDGDLFRSKSHYFLSCEGSSPMTMLDPDDYANVEYFFTMLKLNKKDHTPEYTCGKISWNLLVECFHSRWLRDKRNTDREAYLILKAEYSRICTWENPDEAIQDAYAYNELLN